MQKKDNNEPTRVALYTRRSKKDIDIDGVRQLDHSEQEKRCYEFCHKNNMVYSVRHKFSDTACVDTRPSTRPGFQSLIQAVINKEFDVLVIYESRIVTRNGGSFADVLAEFARLGVAVCSVAGRTDTRTSDGLDRALRCVVRPCGFVINA